MLDERRGMVEELRLLKQGKFAEAEAVVKLAAEEKNKALHELESVQKQRQREAENATRQTKIALNTLRREKETLAEQVRLSGSPATAFHRQRARRRTGTAQKLTATVA